MIKIYYNTTVQKIGLGILQMYLKKNTIKTVIFWNISIQNNFFLFEYIFKWN